MKFLKCFFVQDYIHSPHSVFVKNIDCSVTCFCFQFFFFFFVEKQYGNTMEEHLNSDMGHMINLAGVSRFKKILNDGHGGDTKKN
jgi:hypothetical protein